MEQEKHPHTHPRKLEHTIPSSQPYAALCNAVVTQACKDYRHALRWMKYHPHQMEYMRRHHDNVWVNPQWTIDECEDFFLNDMGLYSDLDGEWLMREIQRMVDDE